MVKVTTQTVAAFIEASSVRAFHPNRVFKKMSALFTSSGVRDRKASVLHASEAADVTILGIVFVNQRCLISTKHGLINADRGHLYVVNIADINSEIKPIPRWFHPAVSEEQATDFVWIRVIQLGSLRDFIPLRKPSVKHTMRNYLRYRFVIGMNSGTFRCKDDPRAMLSNQSRDRDPRFDGVTNQPIAKG
jgi:hypothetical protein